MKNKKGSVVNKRKKVKKKLWQLLSLYVRSKNSIDSSSQCVTCGKSALFKDMNCGHYIHNSDNTLNANLNGNELWWDERNLAPQCRGCNKFKRGAPRKFALYLEKEYGDGILQQLNKLYLKPKKFSVGEIERLIDVYENKLKT